MNKLTTAIAGERNKIAKVLHDGLCQDLMGATMAAQVLAANLSSERHPQAEEASHLQKMLKKASDEIHAIHAGLKSSPGAASLIVE